MRGNPYVAKDAPAADAMPDSVPPGKTYEVTVTVTDWENCAGQHIDLSIINGSADNGTATIAPNQIDATTTVTVTGVNQTAPGKGGNLKIQAMLGGRVLSTSGGFTVCAHPINYRDTYDSDIDNARSVGMIVQDDWDSDSGTFADLHETEISEVVQQGARTVPPFVALAGAVIRNSGYQPGDDKSTDTHAEPRPAAGPAGTAVKTQLCVFKCHRCGVTDKVQPSSGFKITHEVFQAGAQWKHKVTKIGAGVTIGANTTSAGNANAVSPNHNLP